ncbi:hypothetical protein ASPZODRAFT_126551 [Penicilliopsis zonata CBS 506.65]|uniref:Hydrophobin n=1 Tax=Penicilliopsis zonata CBS 506.65 TaxID=1073090 RepID=A0A1L9SU45_9EURO|nr:hypothetical protein ASPZODRAFT_126551 [Penicilliopsis zonata CBS 506.65]OJJ50644.1 hypothetical protein ASPZODRAFT_126551 [Penicilliopsis zonata CBS 506.65]
MRFIAPLLFTLAVAALPGRAPAESNSQSSTLTIDQAKTAYAGEDIACCNSVDSMKGDGILGNLIGQGILPNLLGQGDSACAKTSLIDNLQILGNSFFHFCFSLFPLLLILILFPLGLTKQTDQGEACSGTTAVCPKGEKEVSSACPVAFHFRCANCCSSARKSNRES